MFFLLVNFLLENNLQKHTFIAETLALSGNKTYKLQEVTWLVNTIQVDSSLLLEVRLKQNNSTGRI